MYRFFLFLALIPVLLCSTLALSLTPEERAEMNALRKQADHFTIMQKRARYFGAVSGTCEARTEALDLPSEALPSLVARKLEDLCHKTEITDPITKRLVCEVHKAVSATPAIPLISAHDGNYLDWLEYETRPDVPVSAENEEVSELLRILAKRFTALPPELDETKRRFDLHFCELAIRLGNNKAYVQKGDAVSKYYTSREELDKAMECYQKAIQLGTVNAPEAQYKVAILFRNPLFSDEERCLTFETQLFYATESGYPPAYLSMAMQMIYGGYIDSPEHRKKILSLLTKCKPTASVCFEMAKIHARENRPLKALQLSSCATTQATLYNIEHIMTNAQILVADILAVYG